MAYNVEIILMKQAGPGSDEGMPRYRLPGDFPDAHVAEAAARGHIDALGKNLSEAKWRVLGPMGEDIGLFA